MIFVEREVKDWSDLTLPELAARGTVVSNTRQVQSAPIAEHVFALLLALTRQLPLALERQRDARDRGGIHRPFHPIERRPPTLIATPGKTPNRRPRPPAGHARYCASRISAHRCSRSR